MALHLHILPTASFSKGFAASKSVPIRVPSHGKSVSRRVPSHHSLSLNIRSQANSVAIEPMVERRNANYPNGIWDFDFVQSIRSNYTEEAYKSKINKLVEEVKHRLNDKDMGYLCQLELVDDIQRLGVDNFFEGEIKKILDPIASMKDLDTSQESLHATALRFRLLRQNGYDIREGLFSHLKDEEGNFIKSYLDDVKGVLSLYEAAYLSVEGENLLEEAKDITRAALEGMKKGNIEPVLKKKVIHALELPLHWRMPRLAVRWYIEMYDTMENPIPALSELSKLNFNIIQAVHQKDLLEMLRWWKEMDLDEHLGFLRDSLVPCFFWTVGLNPEPIFSQSRMELTKSFMLITVIDDVYDVYGSLEELELFTEAVRRWDIKAMEPLPEYMKIVFLCLFNTVNDMGFLHIKEQGFDSINFMKQAWVNQCESYMIEAKWYHNNYKTTLEEFLEVGITSVAGYLMLAHAFTSMRLKFPKEALDCFKEYPSLLFCTGKILRLTNDFGTAKDELARGDVLKSIQSYMHQTGVSEYEARKHIMQMINETWTTLNTDLFFCKDSPLPKRFIETTVNIARTSTCVYQHGDGHATIDIEKKERTALLLFEPIPLKEDT